MRNHNRVFKSTVGNISDMLNEKKEIKALTSINEGIKTQGFKDKKKVINTILIAGVLITGAYVWAGTRSRRAYI